MNSVVLDGVIAGSRVGELDGDSARPSGQSPVTLRPARPSSAIRRILAFAGPGYMIAVGYMDPGNWATSLRAGSVFGYTLLSVILLSNMMAMLLQAAAVRLGLASGFD